MTLAYIGLGNVATSDLTFYASVSKFHDETKRAVVLGNKE